MAGNPVDDAAVEESLLHRLFWFRRLSLWGRQRAVPRSILEASILEGASGGVFGADFWGNAIDVAIADTEAIQRAVLTRAYRDGFIQIPGEPLIERAADLAARDAGKRAVALIKDVDRATRRNVQRLIRNASAAFVRDPSPRHVEELERAISRMIGLTTHQAQAIERWERAARKAGMSETAIFAEIRRRTAVALDRRAAAIAERAIVEAANFGLHQAWLEADKDGLLPTGVMKLWRNQGDQRVRPTHREQTRLGPIPLNAVYSLHGVQHPPSPDFGCRCWEELVLPGERPMTADERVESIPIARIDPVRPVFVN